METLATLTETLMETFYGVTGAGPRWNVAELIGQARQKTFHAKANLD